MLLKRGHEAMIEHGGVVTVKFICDRGVSHEIVRHRLASYGQESTRYCNYSADKFDNEITVIEPCFWIKEKVEAPSTLYVTWMDTCQQAEKAYFDLLKQGAQPQEARSVLPNSLKTEIGVMMNMREWRHFFKLRTPLTAHPQMRELTIPLLEEFRSRIPILFDDVSNAQ
jgi:thymidylate synthase (FAD)